MFSDIRRRVTDESSTLIDPNAIDEFPDESSIDPFLSDDQQGLDSIIN